MKKIFNTALLILLSILLFGCNVAESDQSSGSGSNNSSSDDTASEPADDTAAEPVEFEVKFVFAGPSTSTGLSYVAWIEDESGNNLQNLYVTKKLSKETLLGDALPYWSTLKRPQNGSVDGVTGASTNLALTITRDLNPTAIRKIRVCFEIDRSKNDNSYFYDRPSFIYWTDIIDLDSLNSSYSMSLIGWMANDSTGTTYGQQPKATPTPSWFSQYTLITDKLYIELVNDMVTNVTVHVTHK